MGFRREKNSTEDENEGDGSGETWIWTAIDAKTRLMTHVFAGDRTEKSGREFIMEMVRRLAGDKPLFTSDELKVYVSLLLEQYHEMIEVEKTGRPGRPRGPEPVVHEDLDYATVHKTREKGRVVKMEKKIVFGNAERIAARLETSPSHSINTAYVERMNGILRQMDAHLKRKSLTFAKSFEYLKAKLHLVVACYNFVRPHGTLSRNEDRTYTQRTPAMAAGLATQPWTVEFMLGVPQLCNG